ncbi:acetamidase-like protein [Calycina marina]|uniref:Acetamidase-like protein n=1 Tax=Calycina marina TaxID=1763456 RepID=A0A9P7Z1J1_9HELO|nr:acetamidase-like protein [Calycina marina]
MPEVGRLWSIWLFEHGRGWNLSSSSVSIHPLPADITSRLPQNLTTVPRTSGHFTPHQQELEIIDSDAADIHANIRNKTWSSVQVKAFCKAATVAQQLTNCLTEIPFPEALARSHFLDAHFERTGTPLGPLHGLPISPKICFVTPPHPSSIGMACYANLPTAPSEETVLVTIVAWTVSHVWGETNGAWNRGTIWGGSSGGEGVLLAMRGGGVLGVGTDMGGSIRIPAAFNGLHGIWRTSGIPGQEFIYANNGPMSPSLSSLKLYFAAVLSAESAPWNLDPKCLATPLAQQHHTPRQQAPLRHHLRQRRHYQHASPHGQRFRPRPRRPQSRRNCGLDESEQRAGFESMRGYETVFDQGELGTLGPMKLREMVLRRNALPKTYLDRWMRTGADGMGVMGAIIAPASPWTVMQLGCFFCTFPLTFADQNVDAKRSGRVPLNERDAVLPEDYHPELYDGTPVVLQCVGRRLEDEKVLELTGIIADALKAVS